MQKGMDCHIHTFYQRCGNETLSVPNIIRRAEALGLRKIAITDHLRYNKDKLEAFHYIKSDIDAVETDIEVFFGVELDYMECDGDFFYSREIHEDIGFEVVIGGIHQDYTDSQDISEVTEIQHRHFMKTLNNPLLDVLVHPFWFNKGAVEKRAPEFWEKLIVSVPDEMITEMAEASAENRCAIEVNSHAVFWHSGYTDKFKHGYVEFLNRLKEKGALFATGSDAHDINYIGHSYYAEGILHGLNVPKSQIWWPQKGE